jgi:hypothetical protein
LSRSGPVGQSFVPAARENPGPGLGQDPCVGGGSRGRGQRLQVGEPGTAVTDLGSSVAARTTPARGRDRKIGLSGRARCASRIRVSMSSCIVSPCLVRSPASTSAKAVTMTDDDLGCLGGSVRGAALDCLGEVVDQLAWVCRPRSCWLESMRHLQFTAVGGEPSGLGFGWEPAQEGQADADVMPTSSRLNSPIAPRKLCCNTASISHPRSVSNHISVRCRTGVSRSRWPPAGWAP